MFVSSLASSCTHYILPFAKRPVKRHFRNLDLSPLPHPKGGNIYLPFPLYALQSAQVHPIPPKRKNSGDTAAGLGARCGTFWQERQRPATPY